MFKWKYDYCDQKVFGTQYNLDNISVNRETSILVGMIEIKGLTITQFENDRQ